jgi:hypothetical protein
MTMPQSLVGTDPVNLSLTTASRRCRAVFEMLGVSFSLSVTPRIVGPREAGCWRSATATW